MRVGDRLRMDNKLPREFGQIYHVRDDGERTTGQESRAIRPATSLRDRLFLIRGENNLRYQAEITFSLSSKFPEPSLDWSILPYYLLCLFFLLRRELLTGSSLVSAGASACTGAL